MNPLCNIHASLCDVLFEIPWIKILSIFFQFFFLASHNTIKHSRTSEYDPRIVRYCHFLPFSFYVLVTDFLYKKTSLNKMYLP